MMLRRTPLVFKNLSHQLARTIVSIGGIMLAIVLMFMQMGFAGAVGDTATMVYDRMDFQLVIRSPDYLHLFEASTVDDSVPRAIAALPGVHDVRTLDTFLGGYSRVLDKAKLPDGESYDSEPKSLTGQFTTSESRGIAIFGIDLSKPAFTMDELRKKLPEIKMPTRVLIDRKSSKDFIPENGKTFSDDDIYTSAEVNGVRVTIAGTFEMGTGLAAAGAIIVSKDEFQRLTSGINRGRTSLVLIRCEEDQVLPIKSAIEERLKTIGYDHLSVLTEQEVIQAEKRRWVDETPVGMIFRWGVVLAVIVGAVICYMVLASDVIAKLPEYATLKAIGYSNRFLSMLLIKQALTLAICALIPAYFLSLLLYWLTSIGVGVDINMTFSRVLIITGLSLGMCVAAGLIAVRKLAKAEPASLF